MGVDPRSRSAYWGPVVGTLVLTAVGLSLTTAPATDAIMGTVPRSNAGVGSAINDTARELGGTFGVAVVGSAFASVYGAKVADLLRDEAVPEAAREAAGESVVAAAEVALAAPSGTAETIMGAAREAFLDGMATGSRVAAAACLVGAALAMAFLSRRPAAPASDDPTRTSTAARPSRRIRWRRVTP